VPITAQTLGVMLAGSVLGARRGALAVGTFLLLVAAGLPLLSGGRGGLSVFVSPSGGFLIGFLFGAFVIGALVERRPARLVTGWIVLANLVGGIAVVYAFGIAGMVWFGHLSVLTAAVKCATFLPGDLIKVAVASVVTAGVLRGYPAAIHTAAKHEEPVG
jgi:biotin transport system substrate-specific component